MLRVDPLRVFHLSKTPIGLYARQKWLSEGDTTSWRNDFNQTLASLEEGQLVNGSWGNSRIYTIKNLFDLHLTVRELSSTVSAALDWLMKSTLPLITSVDDNLKEKITTGSMRGLPFYPGRYDILMVTSTLFLASVFGRGNDNRVLDGYIWLDQEITRKAGYLCGWKCLSNVLRALVVHEVYSSSRSTALIVQALEKIQTTEGNWQGKVPFYRILNALAHLDTPIANSQFELALKRVYKTQSQDGSWGKAEPEFYTFLVVHALKRKGLI